MYSIEQIFPNIIKQKDKINHPNYEVFFDSNTNEYIGIPKDTLTDREKQLLQLFFSSVQLEEIAMNSTTVQQAWYEYFYNNGEHPTPEIDYRLRFIHFYLPQKGNFRDFLEAAEAYFHDELLIVWIDEQNGVIIEKETNEKLVEEELLSFKDALLSDFYMNVYFYMGRFYSGDGDLRSHFNREQQYFQIAKPFMKKEHIFRFEHAFPIAIMVLKDHSLRNVLRAEWNDIFQDDFELVGTVRLFLENNSNTSLTAKKLYLHRNSLQYRIDKFIERTTIDIKLFQGAISVYFICLFGEHIEQK